MNPDSYLYYPSINSEFTEKNQNFHKNLVTSQAADYFP